MSGIVSSSHVFLVMKKILVLVVFIRGDGRIIDIELDASMTDF